MSAIADSDLAEQGVPENDVYRPYSDVLLKGAPRISAALAALTRRLGRGLCIELGGHAAELTLRSVVQDVPLQHKPLCLSGAAGRLQIFDGARLLRVLTGIDMTSMSTAGGGYPDWLVAAVAGRLAGTPFEGVIEITSEADFPDHDVCTLSLSLRQDSHVVTVTARAAPTSWLAMLEAVAATPVQANLAEFLDLVVAAPVLLGRHHLPLSAWSTLAVGDIILPDSPNFDVAGTGIVYLARCGWRVRYLAPGNLQLIALENIVNGQQPDDTADSADTDAVAVQQEYETGGDKLDSAQLDQVPLTLSFELGRIGLPLAQIRALAPQTILTLHHGGPRTIAIVCSGRTVGHGEVVDVDGVLGIRIVQWGGAC
jgi:type III secretion protein Q